MSAGLSAGDAITYKDAIARALHEAMFDAETEVEKAQWYNDLEAKFGRMLQGR